MSDPGHPVDRAFGVRSLAGLAILVIAFGASVAYVFHQSFLVGESVIGKGKKVITFAHWQLEGRTVEALNWAGAEYMKLHPDVHVRQIDVPERGYKQWVRTQLIGRTAPDLIESYFSPNITVRYFSPITDVVEKPNPYNKGTDLESVPWRQTYIDGMKGGWDHSLQEYYKMPLSVFTVRIYANKDLLAKAAAFLGKGPVAEPETLGELLQLCEDVKAYGAGTGKHIVPIAGSDYTARIFREKYWVMATWGLLEAVDRDLDGRTTLTERLEAFVGGAVDLRTDPHMRAAHQVLFDLSRHFNPGFMAAKRDQSVFLFAQGNAAMVATGSWDAGSLYRQVGDDFRIVVFDFPVAGPDDTRYGPYVRNRPTEAGARAGFPFALTRQSKHPDVAVDFMHFLTSRKINEEINKRFRWFPATIGAGTDEVLKPFAPKVEGVYKVFWPDFGSDTTLSYQQRSEAYISEDEPQTPEFEQFRSAWRSDPGRFRARYGRLAEAFLARDSAARANYGYRDFLADWRDEHYRQFINSYADDVDRYALGDYLRIWENTYPGIVQAEAPLAHARARAIRRGVTADPTGEIKRNLSALVFGQARRIIDRAQDKRRYDDLVRRVGHGKGARP